MPRREIDLQGRLAADIDGLPLVASAGEGRLYYDSTRGSLRFSKEEEAFADVVTDSTSNDWVVKEWDFAGQVAVTNLPMPLTSDEDGTNRITVNSGDVISCIFRVNRPGRLAGIAIIGGTNLANADNSNFLTFAAVNKLGDGSGSIALLAATDANTTKLTGGSGLTAFVSRSLTLSSTALNLAVTVGDVIQVTATVTGTLANAVLFPAIRLQIIEIPIDLGARVTRTASILAPLIAPVSSSAGNGEALIQANSGSGINAGAIDFQDRLDVLADGKPVFYARIKVSGATANQAFAWGLASNNPGQTLDNATHNAQFRVEGASLALLWETDDATLDDDDNATSPAVTLVADTYNDYVIDMTDLNAVLFQVDGVTVGTGDMGALPANSRLQPFATHARASGTATDSMTIERFGVRWRRA